MYFLKCQIFFIEYKYNFIEYKNAFLLQISKHSLKVTLQHENSDFLSKKTNSWGWGCLL